MALQPNNKQFNIKTPKYRTWEERIELCNLWKRSGTSRSEFIRQQKLPKTFHYWCNKLWPKSVDANNSATLSEYHLSPFVQMVARSSSEHITANMTTETEKIEMFLSTDVAQVKLGLTTMQAISLIRGLNNANTVI